jgi:Hypervirulence associated proteins TUDOR domain
VGANRGRDFVAGVLVSWIGSEGMVTGRVVRRLTAPAQVGTAGLLGARVRASEDYPYILVKSDIGGHQFARRPGQLIRI